MRIADLEAGDVDLTIAEYEKARKVYEELVPGEGPATLEQAVAARTASLAARNQLKNMASALWTSDVEKAPKPGSLMDALQRANRAAMAASEALEERQYTPARSLFTVSEKLYREAAALQGKRDQIQASRQSAMDSMKLADAAFKTDARPASFELGKQALADADKALAEDDTDAAKPFLTQAAEQFAAARAEAEQLNALAEAQQVWSAALASADEELLNKHAASQFQAAKAKADEAQTKASIALFQEATTALNDAVAGAKTKENAAKAAPVMARIETAVAAKNRFLAEDILVELENLIPTDPRMAGLREKVTALPGPKKKIIVDLGGGVVMELVLIKPGSFMMGSEKSGDEKPVHKVTITKPFYMGKYEVTQEQWEKVTGNNPCNFKGPKLPVENVSWDDCQAFMAKLKEKAPGLDFRLPTEAQWEYACRAGTTTACSFGDADGLLGEYAWYDRNAGSTTHDVGGLKPNAWGLYDMHGNVWEWCLDWYNNTGYTSGDASDPAGASSGSGRVLRGGSWINLTEYCRSAYRFSYDPGVRNLDYGFRVVGILR